MNFKTTALLVAILALIGAIWYFLPRATPPESITPAPTTFDDQKSFFDPKPKDEEIVRVEVGRPGKPRMAFERVPPKGTETRLPDDWRMLEPVAAPADGPKVMALVRALTALQTRSRFEAGAAGQVTVAEAGLEPPVASVTLGQKDGKQLQVEIGKKAALSTDTYVRLAGEKTIQVASRELGSLVDKGVKDYRALRLFKFNLEEIVRLQAQYEGKSYDFSKGPDGEWVINEPVHAYGDKAKIREKLLTPLNGLMAVEFLDDAAAAQGLDHPYLTLRVTSESKRTKPTTETEPAAQTQPEYETEVESRNLVIGDVADLKAERRFARTEEGTSVLVLKQADITALVPNLHELRDARVTRVKAGDITALDLTAGSETASLKKVGGKWQGTGDLAELDADAVSALIEGFAGLTALSYVDQPEALDQYGLAAPRAVLSATAVGLTTPIAIRLGHETASGRNVYVQREGEPGVIVTSETQAAKLSLSPLTLRSREVFVLPLDSVQKLVVTRGATRYEANRDGGTWRLLSPADTPVDATAAANMAHDLSRLRAKSVVAKGAAATYGLDKPELVIQFEAETAPAASGPVETAPAARATHTLRVAPHEGKTYASKDDDPYIFELDETVERVLTAELIDAQLFTFKPEEVARVKIVSTGGTLEFVRQNNRWEYAPEPFIELAQTKVQDFVRDIARLRAESYVAYRGGDLVAKGLDQPPAAVMIRLNDGRELALNLAQLQQGELPRLAALPADRRIFRLALADVQKLMRGLDEYLPAEKSKAGASPATAEPQDE